MRLQGIFYTLFFISLSFFATAQSRQPTVNINTIVERTNTLATQMPFEKVYLHFDKPYYAVGDTVWFKSYVMNTHLPSAISKTLYIESINERDSIMGTFLIGLEDGVGEGHILLDPMKYKQGNYRIRSYTKYMMNFDPAYFFNKSLTIADVFNKRVSTHANFSAKSDAKSTVIGGTIRYTNERGDPEANKRVNWEVVRGTESLLKGRGTTDSQGLLKVNISHSDAQLLKNGTLHTVISLTEDRNTFADFALKKAFDIPDVQFFPEGGYLIADITSKVAFKAVAPDGLGVEVEGTIIDQNKQEVANFKSNKLGMGAVSLTPTAEATYTAQVKLPNGTTRAYALPKVRPFGITFAIAEKDDSSYAVEILSNGTYLEQNKGKTFSVVAQSNGAIYYAAQSALNSEKISTVVPKDKFPNGIVSFHLFSPTGIPLSERLVFNQIDSLLDLKITSDKKSYTPKEQVTLNVSALDSGKATHGSYSIAVVDETKVPMDEDGFTTILTSFLLTSDLQGYVEKPNYYFNKANENAKADLDVLLLTQGYRRVDFKKIIADKADGIVFLPEQGIDIRGSLRQLNGLPVANGKLQMSIKGKKTQLETLSDVNGNFSFSNVMIADSSEVTISARNNDNYRNLKITLEGDNFPAVTPSTVAADNIVNIDSTIAPYIQNSERQYRMQRMNMLDEVVITARAAPKPRHTEYPALSGLSPVPDHFIDGSRFTGCNMLIQCLQTAAMGLTFMDNFFYVTRDYNQGSRVPVQVFLNGMPIDVNGLMGVMPGEVESVEIFLRDDLGTVNRTYQTNGVLVVNTKKIETTRISKEELANLLPKYNVITFTPLGYIPHKVFYSPKYTPSSTPAADWRTTIYWNPEVELDDAGKATIQYFNADGRGTYKVLMEGFDEFGNLGRSIYRYQVQ
ncbi:hypothetical protein [Olivibacter sitiensis]|uniref:hypothetical protein n=1 Tax=Olivibacter sitiensis TaxID=376470 RepID=UPI000428E5D1|nr:hypothetical protein [Olivibacter sitiensis]